MNVILSSAASADLAEAAVFRFGAHPSFLCLQNPLDCSVASPVRFFGDKIEYLDVLRQEFARNPRDTIFFSTAASDKMQICDDEIRMLAAEYGVRFVGQTSKAVEISTNKKTSKALAEACGLKTPASYSGIADPRLRLLPDASLVVVKRVFGDAGAGQKILRAKDIHSIAEQADERDSIILENFVSGVEVSASVFRAPGEIYMGPLVIKGETSIDNLHSVDKIRAIYPNRFDALEQHLRSRCIDFAAKLDAYGWLDIEFVVGSDGPFFLEVNARFSGLSRLSSLSTGVNPHLANLAGKIIPSAGSTTRFAMELPYSQDDDLPVDGKGISVSKYPAGRRTAAKCTFGSDTLDGLYVAASGLESKHLKGRSRALAEQTASRLEMFQNSIR